MVSSMNVRAKVEDYILQELLPGSQGQLNLEEESLLNSGLLDSIAVLRLIVFLEETFGVSIESHEVGVEHFDSLSGIVGLVESKVRMAKGDLHA